MKRIKNNMDMNTVEIKRLLNKVTPGPWYYRRDAINTRARKWKADNGREYDDTVLCAHFADLGMNKYDKKFLVKSREIVEYLLEYIRELELELLRNLKQEITKEID